MNGILDNLYVCLEQDCLARCVWFGQGDATCPKDGSWVATIPMKNLRAAKTPSGCEAAATKGA